jgi:TIR domain
MPQVKSKGIVFVSNAHDDRMRIEPLVKILASRFNVFWDKEITPGSSWRQLLIDQLDEKRCVVVLWTINSVRREFVWPQLERVKERGVIVPALLDTFAKVPLGFNGWQYINLTKWEGKHVKLLTDLLKIVGDLVARPGCIT